MRLTASDGKEYEFETPSHNLDFEKDNDYKVGIIKPIEKENDLDKELEKIAWDYIDVSYWTQDDFDTLSNLIKSTILEAIERELPKTKPEDTIFRSSKECYEQALADCLEVVRKTLK